MSADKYLGLDLWSASALHALDGIYDDTATALHNFNVQFGEHEGQNIRDALIAALAAIDIHAKEIRDAAVREDADHQLHELGVDDEEDAA